MWRYLIALPLIMHGLAHAAGMAASRSPGGAGFTTQPWIFSQQVYLSSGSGRLFGWLWLVAMLVLVGSGLGLVLQKDWWLPLAIAGCVLSLLVIVPWWNTIPPGAKFGAFFDVLVLVVLLTPLQGKVLEFIRSTG